MSHDSPQAVRTMQGHLLLSLAGLLVYCSLRRTEASADLSSQAWLAVLYPIPYSLDGEGFPDSLERKQTAIARSRRVC